MSEEKSHIISEIEQDIQNEKYEKIWKQYGNYIVVGVGAIIGLSVMFNIYQSNQEKKNELASVQFNSAQENIANNRLNDALSVMSTIAKGDHKNYAILAQFSRAGIYNGDSGYRNLEKAKEIYQEIMNNKNADQLFKDLAAVFYSNVCLDLYENKIEKIDELIPLLTSIADTQKGFYLLAKELLGVIYFNKNDYKKASEYFLSIAQDKNCPQDMGARVKIMSQETSSKMQ